MAQRERVVHLDGHACKGVGFVVGGEIHIGMTINEVRPQGSDALSLHALPPRRYRGAGQEEAQTD